MIERFNSTLRAGGNPRRLTQKWLLCLAVLLAVMGAISVSTGSLMPAYTDPVAAERIRSGSECEIGVQNKDENVHCDSELWRRSMNSLRTDKWSLVDLGAGLLASALSILVLAGWNGQKSWKEAVTPRRSLSILALVSLSWLMQIPGYEIFFLTELARGYYPWWADSVAIPIYQTRSIVLTLFLPYLVIWSCFVVGARLPALVFSTVPGRPVVSFFWTFATALLSVPIGLCLIGAIMEGPIVMVPFLWLTLCLTLCARAAALTRHC